MSNQQLRPAGKRGKRPARHVPQLRLDRFRSFAPPPPTGDVSKGITSCGMLGNDRYGCCGYSALQHGRMLKAATGANPDGTGIFTPGFVVPTDAATLADYFGYGVAQGEGPPGSQPDQGVENATMLAMLYAETGGTAQRTATDIEEWGYAQLDHANQDQIHRAMLDYDGVLLGVSLPDDAETRFSQGQPWDVTAASPPDPNMGHDIWLCKYDANGETVLTWGAQQACTLAFDGQAVDEAWVFFSREDAERTDVDWHALRAELQALGGTARPGS